MRLAMAAAEAVPFAKTGGLADVMGALPQALAALPDTEVSLFLPYHKQVAQSLGRQMERLQPVPVALAWRKQQAELYRWQGSQKSCTVYFIGSRQYFDRDRLYGEADDAERYAFFSKAVLEAMAQLELKPQILHCHDWHTALLPVFLDAWYRGRFPGLKTVFTIHNIAFQGRAELYFCADVLGLPEAYTQVLQLDGAVNLMKGAILLSDAVTTVSETYAREICFDYFGQGLAEPLRRRRRKPTGIVNGIDAALWDPAHDANLAAAFSPDTLERKKENKLALQNRLGLPPRQDVPVLAMVTRLTEPKGIDLLQWIAPQLLLQDVQLVVLGTGEARYERYFSQLQYLYPEKVSANLFFGGQLANQIYAGADLFLMPSRTEPCGIAQMIAMRYGAVPVVHETGGLKDTVPAYNREAKCGSGFTFQSYNADDFLSAITRALELYTEDPAQWQALCKSNMSRDFSWDYPARRYCQLMQTLVSEKGR